MLKNIISKSKYKNIIVILKKNLEFPMLIGRNKKGVKKKRLVLTSNLLQHGCLPSALGRYGIGNISTALFQINA